MANLSDVKNTPKALVNSALALPKAYPFPEFAEAGHQLNTERHNEGGKKRGACQIAYDAGGTAGVRRIMIATGNLPEDKWSVTDTTIASVVPTYTALYPAPAVGVGSDLKPDYRNTANGPWSIASLPFPVVLHADLVDIGNIVNLFEKSGKKRGTVVVVDFGSFLGYAIANGPLPEDAWTVHDGTVLVPVGTPVVPTSTEHSDYKPVVLDVESINSVDFPVFLVADVMDLFYTPLYNPEATTENLNGSQIIVDYGGTELKLMYGIFTDTQTKWLNLGGVGEVVPV